MALPSVAAVDHEPNRLLRGLASLVVRRAVWVLALWMVVAGVVNLAVPQLEEVVADDSTPVVPLDSDSSRAVTLMDQEFGSGRSHSFLVVLAEREGGLTRADVRHVEGLVPRLRQDTENVSFVQDIRDDQVREALTSDDGEAVYLQVGVPGFTGAPSAIHQVEHVREVVRDGAPEGLDLLVTGPSATVSDMAVEAESSILVITIVTIGLIFALLLLIYRRLSVALIILGTVGLSLGVARGLTAWMGLHGVFDVSTFTGSFLTAIVLGAGTDYAIFLVSRYHEQRRLGVGPRTAASYAAGRVSAVIIGSALTVVLANACMLVAELGVYTTTGPAIAVSVTATLLVSITLLPAMLGLLGPRGLFEPRPASAGAGGWARLAALAVHRRVPMALAALVPLVALAALMPAMEPSYDTRGIQPEDTESNRGYAALARHYPVNEVLPEYVLVSSDHDMRNARDLATLEQAAAAAARTPGVALVRSVTRPDGEAIDQARVSYQAGVIGRKLRRAGDDVASGTEGARTLADGSAQVDEGAEELAAGADQAVEGAGMLVSALEELRSGLTRLEDGAGEAVTGTGELREGARMLAAGLEAASSQTQTAVEGLGMALDGLESSLPCTLDPICNRARDGVRQVYEGERDQLLPGLRDAAAAARRIAEGTGDLQAGLRQLDDGLARARAGVEEITAGQREFRARLGELADGTEQLAEGTGQVAAGTSEVAGSVGELEGGLSEAADYLTSTAERADTSAMGGFYLPPAALADDRFAAASRLFISPDGRTARIAVLGTDDAFSSEAAERSTEVRQVIENSLRDSRLQDADVVTTGMASANADLAAIEARDFRLIVAVALVTVFLILLALLRSVVAALFLLATVVLSYASAVGLGVLVFQMILDEPLEWSVPSLAFILLVAVGADYNLLLTKRMQEEAPDGSRAGIARAAAATGGVITAAGVIFAASMFALMAGSVDSLVQTGFVIGAGLLIDTFVVRTMLVPAIAAMLGPRLWWPRRRAPRPTVGPVTTVATR